MKLFGWKLERDEEKPRKKPSRKGKKKYVLKGYKGIITEAKRNRFGPAKKKLCKLIVGGRKRKIGRPKKWRNYRYKVKK